jgi:hypothetical protein
MPSERVTGKLREEREKMSSIKNKTELLLLLLYAGEPTGTFMAASAPVVGITRLEKLIFLAKFDQALLEPDTPQQDFTFLPFRMGPWTQEVYDEVDFLESLGLLTKERGTEYAPEDEAHDDELFSDLVLDKYQRRSMAVDEGTDVFKLTEEGRTKAAEIWTRIPHDEKQKLIALKRRFNNMNLRQLLRYIYKKYPQYTTESEIKESLNIR